MIPLHSFQLPRSHRTILLRLMEKISKEHIHDISEELAKELITLGSLELTLTEVSHVTDQPTVYEPSLISCYLPTTGGGP